MLISGAPPFELIQLSLLPEGTWKGQEKDRVYAGYRVSMESLRYHVFVKSLACEKCGLTGNVMRLEYNDTDKNRTPDRAHFNLYCVREGQEDVMLTKDHILPKSKDGKDTLRNLRNYCAPCNWEHSDERRGAQRRATGGNGAKKNG
mgnify:CR=1 FL=1